ncbi:TonB-dependent receptor plug domain-containing protein [Janthinobacterium sp. LB2P70]|uniref:TonB-dependent receptor plug domain-containing protein n=1 Tax=Janthinobacterium sp. LB2P70 TaxID=3424197 RepID=UPI003F2445D3
MRLRKRKLVAACALASLGLGHQAGAQVQAEAAPVADETRTVRVTGHYDNAVGTSDAASQGVITTELIVNRPALRTGELLEFVPGLIVTQHSGDGKANQYFLRGFNLDHGTDFATYLDGMPVNMRTHPPGRQIAAGPGQRVLRPARLCARRRRRFGRGRARHLAGRPGSAPQ